MVEGQSYYSAVKSLSVESPVGSFNASELNGWNVMVASAGDVDGTMVSSDHTGLGLGPDGGNYSGKIHYDGGTRILTYWYNSARRTVNLVSPADDDFHNLLAIIAVGNEIGIANGKVSTFNKLVSANWNINFDSIQSILSEYVILSNRAVDTNPVKISGTFSGTLSLQGNHTDDAFAVPDGSSLTINEGKLSFNSSSHLVLGINSSLVLQPTINNGAGMGGFGKLVAGQTEFSFGDSDASGWYAGGWTGGGTINVTITRTGAYTSSITTAGGAYLSGISSNTNLPVITQKQGMAGNRLTIGCLVYPWSNNGGTNAGRLVLEGTGADKGLVVLGENGIISYNNNPSDSMGSPGTGITGLDISGGTFMLRKDSGTGKFLFIRRDSGTIDIKPSGSADFTLSAETVVN
jgi:hypothetical protein